ncbi:MAG: oligosaccharide flippase family protein [Meiothermus sp.]|nr:oligosaccharide flippase family protein [Meiothermus sp.]
MSNLMSSSRARLARLLPKGRFARDVGKLAGGAALGQLVVILATPVITRLYTPADFGVLAVFTTLLGITAAMVSLRYELAIPLADDDAEAANLLAVCLLLCVAVSGLLLVAVLVLGASLTRLTNSPSLEPYLWMLPLAVFLAGVYQSLNYWLTRVKRFGPVATTKFSQGFGNALTAIGLGLLHAQPLGLLVGQLVGQSAGTTTLARAGWQSGLAVLRGSVGREAMTAAARKFRRFALYSTPSSLINNIGLWVPPLLFAGLYGPAVAGLVALGDRVARQPLNILGLSIAQVYYSEAGSLASRPQELKRLFLRTAFSLLRVGAVPFALAALLSPWLFGLVFGLEWRSGGVYVQWMALAFFAQFVMTPLSGTLNALQRPDLQAAWDVARLVLVVGGIWLCHNLGGSPEAAFAIYGGGLTLSYLLLFALSYWALERRALSTGVDS